MSVTTSQPPYDLNIGSAHTRIPGFINIDIHERADLTLDLSTNPLPFPDNSVRTVFSDKTLEHIPDYLFALGEIYRVLEHGGELLLVLPYVTLTEMHLVNPYHLHNFSERSFDLFDPAAHKGSAAEANDIMFRRAFVRYRYMGYVGLAPRPFRTFARRHFLNVVRNFDIGLVAIKDPERPVAVGEERAEAMRRHLNELRAAQTPYADVVWPGAARPGVRLPTTLRNRVRKRLQPYRERRTS